ncbi:MAG: CHAT domain-containing tetratricopeptide repeat protein [Fulvivirga sp.]|nr:CHAT domain-containing tetratricopeptide repeat protein [Fulvivirga sp.]
MSIVRSLIFVILFMCVDAAAVAQHTALRTKADHLFKKEQYDSSIVFYRKLLVQTSKNDLTNLTHVLFNLAYAEKNIGQLSQAIHDFKHLIQVTSSQPDFFRVYFSALANLGNLYTIKNQYDSAEIYLSDTDNLLQRKQLSTEDQREVQMWMDNGLALLYSKRGQPARAAVIYERLLQQMVQNELTRVDSVQLHTLHNNLATAYLDLDKYAEAEQHLNKSLTIQDKLGLKHNEDYWQTQSNLASIYRYTDRVEKAAKLLISLIDRFELGEEQISVLYPTFLFNLGELYFEIDDYDQAERWLLKTREYLTQHYAGHSLLFQHTIHMLAMTYLWQNDLDRSEAEFLELVNITKENINRNFTYLTEEEQWAYYTELLPMIYDFELFAMIRGGVISWPGLNRNAINQDIFNALLDIRLATKGLILNASARLQEKILHGADDDIKTNFEKWVKLKNQLAIARNVNEREILMREIEMLGKQLAKSTHHFEETQNVKTWRHVQQRLKAGEAAVEMVRLVDGLLYAAMIVTPKTTNHPAVAVLKSTREKGLEQEFLTNYSNHIQFKLKDTLSHAIYWQAIQDTLNTYSSVPVENIYFSGDGIYHQLNINTFFDQQRNSYLIDQVDIIYLTNLGELVDDQTQQTKRTDMKGLLIGNPDYARVRLPQDTVYVDFRPLPGTLEEVMAIEDVLNKEKIEFKTLTGSKATESFVKNQTEFPEIVHLATHGYFYKQPSETQMMIRAMLQSGIVLATDSSANDGILTAYEMSNLDLSKTHLVVLSACETGLGHVESREGVFGIQRALKIAGADRILMSLWKVDDQVTKELMTSFYKIWMQDFTDPGIAFKKAQQLIRQKYPEPYYWGAFVLLGE